MYSNIIITQVYDFVKERPNTKDKDQNTIVFEYFKELHEGDTFTCKFMAPHYILGKFGKIGSIDIRSCPKFSDKKNFIEWVIVNLKV